MRKKKRTPWLVLLLGLLGLVLFFWWQNNGLVLSRYSLVSKKIPAQLDNVTIVQLSDLHNKQMGNKQQALLDTIAKAQPDLIVITGDIIDSRHTSLEPAFTLVRGAAALAPVYYVTGNHEFRVGETMYQQLLAGLVQAGAVLLDDTTQVLTLPTGGVFSLTGLSDKSLENDTLTQLSKQWDTTAGQFQVLLAHEPQYFASYAQTGVDLVFSGHAHGGQFRLPFLGGLVAPGQGLFPAYTKGLYQMGETTMVVSRGMGNSVIPVRLFNRPEVVALTLVAQ